MVSTAQSSANLICDYTTIGFSLEHIWPYCIWRYPVIQYCVGSGRLEPLPGYWINNSANDWFKEQRIACTGWKGEYRFGVQPNEYFIDHDFPFLMSRVIVFIWWHLGLKVILPQPVLRATRPNSGCQYRHRRRMRHSGSMKPALLLAQILRAYAGNFLTS